MIHQYVSTACQHGLHARCRQKCKFCDVDCLCLCHRSNIQNSLNRIEAALTAVQKQGVVVMQELDDLKAQVEETTTVEQSAIELLNGLSSQIESLKTDPTALQGLADQLRSKSGELAAAVAANTPSA